MQTVSNLLNDLADLSSQSVARLQEYGYSDVDCIAALWESNGDESLALGGLFKSLMSDQGVDNLENGASESLEAAVETREEELVALQSIFEEKTVSLSADFMRFNLSLDNSIEASLEMEVCNSNYWILCLWSSIYKGILYL